MKYFFPILIAILVFSSSFPLASAANLNAYINPENPSSNFTIVYQRVVMIDYHDGGKLADDLNGKSWRIDLSADSSNPGVQDLMQRLNQKIKDDGSSARITDLNVDYFTKLHGRGASAAIDYKIELTGSISDYLIHEYNADNPALIDMGWRAITTEEPIVIDGIEINIPFSIIQSKEPNLHTVLSGTEAETILLQHLIDAQGLNDTPLIGWHFLYDPIGIEVDNNNFELDEEVSGFAVSSFVFPESGIRVGADKKFEASISADKEYLVRSIESLDSAKIDVIGFAAADKLDNIEIIGVTPEAPEGYHYPSTNYQGMFLFSIIGIGLFGIIGLVILLWKKGVIFT